MIAFETAALVVTYLGLSLTAVFALIRVVRGPTILDRMVASDVLLTTLILAVGSDMVLRGHTHSIALMIVIAATSVFATVTVARFVKRRATTEHDSTGNEAAGNEPVGNELGAHDSGVHDPVVQDSLSSEESSSTNDLPRTGGETDA